MNREFENEMDQEEESVKGRSRRRPERGSHTGEGREAGDGSGGSESSHSFVPAYSQTQRSASRERDTAFRRGEGSGSRGRRDAGRDSAKTKARGRRRRIIGMIVAEVAALCIIGSVWYVKHLMSYYQPDDSGFVKGETNPNLPAVKIQEMEGYWTVALFGVDSRNNSVGKGNQSDVIIIANVDWETGEIKLASVYRDTYLNTDTSGSYNKINSAYFRGGADQACKALDRNLDIQIDDFGTFSWKAVADAINILGGVDIEISKAEFRYINAYITETVEATGVASVHLKSAGMNHLDGVQAVAYARLRYMDNDFTRTERQRKVIELCFDKLKKADFSVINNVMVVVLPQIQTSLSLNDLLPMAQNLTKYHIGETTGFPQTKTDQSMGAKGDCVIPDTLESNVIQLHSFLFGDENYTPSSKVKEISAKITSDAKQYRSGGGSKKQTSDETKARETKETDGEETTEGTEGTRETKEGEASSGNARETAESGASRPTLATDEEGNVIDPPEDWLESSAAHGTTSPGETASSHTTVHPGETTAPSEERIPSAPTAPTASSGPGGGTAAEADQYTGPGAVNSGTSAPSSAPAGTVAPRPGAESGGTGDMSGGPGAVIIGPGA